MVKYVCVNCNYRFEAKEPLECPYCGNEKIEKEKNASELLEEIERYLK
ncbi:hypothetical protein GF386_01280 [Candidatus Pacearchaeota archaeon]|nr:hypothetical protein [Candidatus Pacearchaeota archaeon]MBD3282840.1 hypothetical protein [Candidatus Pacearchaeota archaeon]